MGYKLQRKSTTWWMKFLRFWLPEFFRYFWTTIGTTIYVPSIYDSDSDWGSETWCLRHHVELQHELEHVRQFSIHGLYGFLVTYFGPSPLLLLLSIPIIFVDTFIGMIWVLYALVLSPLSLGLAYGRWYLERSAYLINIREGDLTIQEVVDTLWSDYSWTWPRAWMRRWFEEQLKGV